MVDGGKRKFHIWWRGGRNRRTRRYRCYAMQNRVKMLQRDPI